MASVRLRQVRKSFGKGEIVRGIDLDIAHGEFMVLVGASGCGKSTLLRLIAGLENLDSGEIWIDDERADVLPPAQRRVAMVFQNYSLYPHMTVAQNMGFPLKVAGESKAAIREAVGRAAEILRIAHLLDRLPRALSGGERQRVAIGRAIVRKPSVFLFDEPLSNLDTALRGEMRHELLQLHEQLGATIVYVTHDQTEAMTLGTRIALLRAGQVEQQGTPLDLFERPRNLYVGSFLGSPPMNQLKTSWRPTERCWQLGSSRLPAAAFPGLDALPGAERLATLGIRPEAWEVVSPSSDAAGIACTIGWVEHLGDSVNLFCKVEGVEQPIAMRQLASAPIPARGDAIRIAVKAERCHRFDDRGERL